MPAENLPRIRVDRVQRKRKSHKKSRSGCTNCRFRRIKVRYTLSFAKIGLSNEVSSVTKSGLLAKGAVRTWSHAATSAAQKTLSW